MKLTHAVRPSIIVRAAQLALILFLALGMTPTAAQAPEPEVDLEALRDAAYASRVELPVAIPEPFMPADVTPLRLETAEAADVDALAHQSGAWDKLVFQSGRDGNWEIYTSAAMGWCLAG